MELFVVLLLIAAPLLRFLVLAEAENQRGRAEFAHGCILLQFFFALLGRVGLDAADHAQRGGHIGSRKENRESFHGLSPQKTGRLMRCIANPIACAGSLGCVTARAQELMTGALLDC